MNNQRTNNMTIDEQSCHFCRNYELTVPLDIIEKFDIAAQIDDQEKKIYTINVVDGKSSITEETDRQHCVFCKNDEYVLTFPSNVIEKFDLVA